jgi:hypothetical protein
VFAHYFAWAAFVLHICRVCAAYAALALRSICFAFSFRLRGAPLLLHLPYVCIAFTLRLHRCICAAPTLILRFADFAFALRCIHAKAVLHCAALC